MIRLLGFVAMLSVIAGNFSGSLAFILGNLACVLIWFWYSLFFIEWADLLEAARKEKETNGRVAGFLFGAVVGRFICSAAWPMELAAAWTPEEDKE